MAESLLSPSGIKLFGRLFPIAVDTSNFPTELGDNNFLRKQLNATKAKFARIYGFSYEGAYYPLSRPAVFLVHDGGTPAVTKAPSAAGLGDAARGPESIDQTGEARVCCDVASDLLMWEYDKGDFSLRLDIFAGTFEDILLEAEVDAQMQMSSAARMQSAGSARMQISHAARMQMSRSGGG